MTSEFCVALHALVYLSHKNCTQKSEELAENICTHPARVRKVMAKLKKSGLVETREGAEGGYRFSLDPHTVSLDQIAAALSASYVDISWRSGDVDKPCLIASGMGKMMDNLVSELNDTCAVLMKNRTIADIEEELFAQNRKDDKNENF